MSDAAKARNAAEKADFLKQATEKFPEWDANAKAHLKTLTAQHNKRPITKGFDAYLLRFLGEMADKAKTPRRRKSLKPKLQMHLRNQLRKRDKLMQATYLKIKKSTPCLRMSVPACLLDQQRMMKIQKSTIEGRLPTYAKKFGQTVVRESVRKIF